MSIGTKAEFLTLSLKGLKYLPTSEIILVVTILPYSHPLLTLASSSIWRFLQTNSQSQSLLKSHTLLRKSCSLPHFIFLCPHLSQSHFTTCYLSRLFTVIAFIFPYVLNALVPISLWECTALCFFKFYYFLCGVCPQWCSGCPAVPYKLGGKMQCCFRTLRRPGHNQDYTQQCLGDPVLLGNQARVGCVQGSILSARYLFYLWFWNFYFTIMRNTLHR